MQDPIQISRVARFETFELNLKTGELRKGGVKIRLQEQSFQILAALLERPGKLVTREASLPLYNLFRLVGPPAGPGRSGEKLGRGVAEDRAVGRRGSGGRTLDRDSKFQATGRP